MRQLLNRWQPDDFVADGNDDDSDDDDSNEDSMMTIEVTTTIMMTMMITLMPIMMTLMMMMMWMVPASPVLLWQVSKWREPDSPPGELLTSAIYSQMTLVSVVVHFYRRAMVSKILQISGVSVVGGGHED